MGHGNSSWTAEKSLDPQELSPQAMGTLGRLAWKNIRKPSLAILIKHSKALKGGESTEHHPLNQHLSARHLVPRPQVHLRCLQVSQLLPSHPFFPPGSPGSFLSSVLPRTPRSCARPISVPLPQVPTVLIRHMAQPWRQSCREPMPAHPC